MSRTDLAWLAVAAYALHIMEERILDWLGSARKSLHIQLEQENYRVVEAVFLILGAVAAMLAPTLQLMPLSFAAFLLINAIFFHIWPMARTGGLSTRSRESRACARAPDSEDAERPLGDPRGLSRGTQRAKLPR